ncbi:adenylosuccinate lyase [Reichenbachiella versicolor]|uniref:adenylosuccinate lyase n=1 Tax=Reichenbachiella versicolor TaxID=1821036 RepID=UPI000D6EB01C|nr:adenylosuccinate lyase [Reichenbachiella versicolor]
MHLNTLTAISPVDGRYRRHTASMAEYFSEYGLIKYRVHVEIEYFIALCQHPLPQLEKVDSSVFGKLRQIVVEFSEADATEIKEIEKTTNHDVKAVEYFIKKRFDELGLEQFKEFIHFGLTSQDINNTAIPLQLKHAMDNEVIPMLNNIAATLLEMSETWKDVSMLAKTHGQPASPTNLGKEILVFQERLNQQLNMLDSIRYGAKFGGATGNMNAHHIAYPEIDWNKFANNFVDNILGLRRSYPTTQIEHYDDMAALFDNLKRISTILIDFSRDVWQYISMGYFKQKVIKGEVGSSAMPHKVNPIDFENAEGNLGIGNAIFEHLASKLPISRLQRDLTDSTVLRNIGVPVGHLYIALKSLEKGMSKLELNQQAIEYDLDQNWAVVSEAIQTILRREAYPEPYEALKALTRGNQEITQLSLAEFIDSLNVSDELKVDLKKITPFNYTGINPLK